MLCEQFYFAFLRMNNIKKVNVAKQVYSRKSSIDQVYLSVKLNCFVI